MAELCLDREEEELPRPGRADADFNPYPGSVNIKTYMQKAGIGRRQLDRRAKEAGITVFRVGRNSFMSEDGPQRIVEHAREQAEEAQARLNPRPPGRPRRRGSTGRRA